MYKNIFIIFLFFWDTIREYIGRSRGTNADGRLVRFIRYKTKVDIS